MKIYSKYTLVNILLLIGLFVITTSNFVAYREGRQLLSVNQWVNHTHLVIEAAQSALNSLLMARSDIRQSILSHHPTSLHDLQNKTNTILQNIMLLRQLILDNPSQQLRLQKLEFSVKKSLEFMQQILKLYMQNNQQDAVEQLVSYSKYEELKKEVILPFLVLIQEERNLLQVRTDNFTKDAHRSNLFFILATILSEMLFVISLILLNYHLVKRGHAEQSKAESEERLRLLVDNAKDYAIIMLNPEGIITTWNIGAERLKGYKADEVIGRHFSFLYPPEAIASKHYQHQLDIAKQNGSAEEEDFRVRKDGSKFWASIILTALHNEKGELVGYSKITRDLTESRKNETMKSEFISVVSHELRTPLTSIRGALALLSGGTIGSFSEQAKELLDIAYNNSGRLLRLINDILDVEKIESGKIDFHLKIVDLHELVTEAILANKMYAEKFGVTINLIKAQQNIQVDVDPARLIQVLTNLISNAVKFSERGFEVIIAITLHNDTVRVSVEDKGAGIPEEFQSRIFQRFAQADATDTRRKSGTGLGLNISKSIIEKLGGTLNYISKKQEGSIFYVELPIWRGDALIVKNEDKFVTKNKLLICEDDEDQANYLSLLLEATGHHSDIAFTVAQAKALMAVNDYCAILLDLILPDQDGISFIKELRSVEKTRLLPIIVISIIAESGRHLLNGEAFSVIDWLSKPVNFSRLLESITRIQNKISPKLPRILNIEDDVDMQQIIVSLLETKAVVVSAATLREAREKLVTNEFDLVILDLLLPDGQGESLLPLFAELHLPIIVFSSVELDPMYSNSVSEVLVKSKTSGEELVITINDLLKQCKEQS